MRARLTGAVAVLALAASAAPAPAQGPFATTTPSASATPSPSATPNPSPTASPTPTPEEQARAKRDARDRKAKEVRRIYRDFERDGRIDDCDHPKKALKRALRSISDSYDEDFPDFRDALKAAIERHDDGTCEEQATQQQQQNSDGSPGGSTGSSGGTPGGGTTPTTPTAPSTGTTAPPSTPPPPPPSTSPQSGALPNFGGGSTAPGSGKHGTVNPLPGEEAIPEGTPVAPPAAPPAATPAPPASRLIVTRAAAEPNLFVPGTMLAIALLGLLFAGLTALAARRSERLAGVGHAWREAAFRISGGWSDFTDWLRPGR